MASAAQIQADLVQVLVHEKSMNWFTGQLVSSTWNIHREPETVRALVGEIYAALAEYTNHHISAPELRRQLLQLVETQQIPLSPSTQEVRTTAGRVLVVSHQLAPN